MDEIEFRQTYNEAVTAIDDANPRKAYLLMLTLINSLNERISELQMEDED